MRINHRGADIFVPQQVLDSANVQAVLQQVRCVRVEECVITNLFINFCLFNRRFDCSANIGSVKMMTAFYARSRVSRDFTGGK